ncbi:hypothetical protein DPEC_G00124810 [Dallia pectoralis]|uniref:Uncharacterized protein n=1 Tax=Dallia pectoralis TaxID=75939 RepID=A0ACC2GR21_DALPE|nr:hypothetical protein DPEC_G00124810 [Dallia pectoralis]
MKADLIRRTNAEAQISHESTESSQRTFLIPVTSAPPAPAPGPARVECTVKVSTIQPDRLQEGCKIQFTPRSPSRQETCPGPPAGKNKMVQMACSQSVKDRAVGFIAEVTEDVGKHPVRNGVGIANGRTVPVEDRLNPTACGRQRANRGRTGEQGKSRVRTGTGRGGGGENPTHDPPIC